MFLAHGLFLLCVIFVTIKHHSCVRAASVREIRHSDVIKKPTGNASRRIMRSYRAALLNRSAPVGPGTTRCEASRAPSEMKPVRPKGDWIDQR
jgi:hypothetical protein